MKRLTRCIDNNVIVLSNVTQRHNPTDASVPSTQTFFIIKWWDTNKKHKPLKVIFNIFFLLYNWFFIGKRFVILWKIKSINML